MREELGFQPRGSPLLPPGACEALQALPGKGRLLLSPLRVLVSEVAGGRGVSFHREPPVCQAGGGRGTEGAGRGTPLISSAGV